MLSLNQFLGLSNPNNKSLSHTNLKPHPLLWLISGSSFILFLCSSLRHWLLQSHAFDLGIFDQAVYLISQLKPPISSFLGYHILGDHVSWFFYLIAPLYKICPDVHWLFAIQAIGLSLGALPTYALARQVELDHSRAIALAVVYLLYPLVFNINLFDFHPDVLVPAALLGAIWAARSNRTIWFTLIALFILSLKAAFSLTLAAMGIWLLLFEKKRRCGIIALSLGIAWFLVTTQWIMPFFSGSQARALDRYAALGHTPLEIAASLFIKPKLVLQKLLTIANLQYVCQLILPVIWGLQLRCLAPLIGVIPALVMNLFSDNEVQKNLLYQYSLPILPFLIVSVISALASGRGWFKLLQPRQINWIIISWSLVLFLRLAEYKLFTSDYLTAWNTRQATQMAIAQIQTKAGVLTDNRLAAQLSERTDIYLVHPRDLTKELPKINYVLLDLRHPDQGQNQRVEKIFNSIRRDPDFRLRYEKDDVYLFTSRASE